MKEFSNLIEVLDHLLGPTGCPWDKKQTMVSMRASIIEEAYEVIDAIDLNDAAKIREELGDLFWSVAFMARLAEKEGKGTIREILQGISDKLVRRHPHVFGDVKLDSTEQVVQQWEQIKREEKKNAANALADIPKAMPALARAQKVWKRIGQTDYAANEALPKVDNEEQLGNALLDLARAAQKVGIDAELALKHCLARQEKEFLAWEKKEGAQR